MKKIKVVTEQPWESIEDVLSSKGIKKLKPGQVLIFDFEGSPIHLKIMRKASNGKVWAKRVHLYTDEEVKQEVSVEKVK